MPRPEIYYSQIHIYIRGKERDITVEIVYY